jgi:hypothetical protein
MPTVLHEAQARALRAMSIAERMRLNASLWDHARVLKEAALRAMHPEWSEEQVRNATREALQNARG